MFNNCMKLDTIDEEELIKNILPHYSLSFNNETQKLLDNFFKAQIFLAINSERTHTKRHQWLKYL